MILHALSTLWQQSPQGQPTTHLQNVVEIPREQAALRIAAAIAIGLVLALVYRRTHKGLSYSQAFTQTIVFTCLIVALVMMTVSDSLAKAFTLVGALSIIRFRTVVKDTRDTSFVFGSLALGMAAGLGLWELAAIGAAAVVALAFVLHATNFGAMHKSEFLLRFTFDQARDSEGYLRVLREAANRSQLLHVEPSGDGGSLRLSFDVGLPKGQTAEALTSALAKVDGVRDVVLLVGKNDVDY